MPAIADCITAKISITGETKLADVRLLSIACLRLSILIFLVLPTFHEDSIPSAHPPIEVTKVALRLRFLIENCVPCELEPSLLTQAHSRIITQKVIQAAKEAGGSEYGACVVYCLLVNKRWFKKQAMLELWDADLHNVRAVACEVIAKQL